MNRHKVFHYILASTLFLISCTNGPGAPPRQSPSPTPSIAPTASPSPPQSGGTIEGTITTSGFKLQQTSGQGVSGALVSVLNSNLKTTSDAQGQFKLTGVPTGQHLTLEAQKPDQTGQMLKFRQQVRVPDDKKTLNLGSLFLRQTGSIFGQVTLQDESSFTGIDAFVEGTSQVAKTDSSGAFALSDVPEGEYRVAFAKAGFVTERTPLTIKVVAGKPSAVPPLSLKPDTAANLFGVISGTVTGQDGKPLAGATVALGGSDLTQSHATLSDENGKYVLGRIEPNGSALMPDGSYRLAAHRDFYDTAIQEVSVKAGQKLTQDLTLQSQEVTLGRLNVTVKDCNGAGVPSALIQLDPAPAFGGNTFTDNNGKHGFTQLFPGQYTVHAAKGSHGSISEPVNIDNAATGTDGGLGALAALELHLAGPNCAQGGVVTGTQPVGGGSTGGSTTIVSGGSFDGGFVVTVVTQDAAGNPVLNGLSKDNFALTGVYAQSKDGKTISASSVTVKSLRTNANRSSVALDLDSSGSMHDNDPNRNRVKASQDFIEKQGSGVQSSVWDFGSSGTMIRLLQDFTSDKALLKAALDRVVAGGSTPMYASLERILADQGQTLQNTGAIIALTDGQAQDVSRLESVIQAAKDKKVAVYTVGLERKEGTLDFKELQKLALSTGGTFANAIDSSALGQIFSSFSTAVKGSVDVLFDVQFAGSLTPGQRYELKGSVETTVSGPDRSGQPAKNTFSTGFQFPIEAK